MPLFSTWIVTAAGLFSTSAGFCSFTENRDAFNVHPTAQIWTASKLCRQLWKNSRFGAVSTNRSKFDLGYAVGHVCWDNESRHLETCQVANRKDGSLTDEQLDGFSNVVTNSSGAVIGGSCGTGGFFLFCVLIYLLYRLLRDDRSVHPTTGHDPPPRDAIPNTNQNGASCPHCRPPPPYNEVVAMGECVDLGACMSAPPANSKPFTMN